MKKIFFPAIIILVATTILKAQNKAVYGELGGNGLVFSANYDMRFTKAENGLGFRAGLGFAGVSDVTIFTFPVGLNYLTGKGPHHMELGLGATYVSATVSIFDTKETGGAFFYMPTVGYRYAHEKKGFVGRIYVGPVFAGSVVIFPWGGLSAGIKF